MQRIPFNRPLATLLGALACKGDVEQMQRILFNWFLSGRRRIGDLSPRSGHKTDFAANSKAHTHIPTRFAAHPGHNRIAPIAPIWKMRRALGHRPNCTDCAALPQGLVHTLQTEESCSESTYELGHQIWYASNQCRPSLMMKSVLHVPEG